MLRVFYLHVVDGVCASLAKIFVMFEKILWLAKKQLWFSPKSKQCMQVLCGDVGTSCSHLDDKVHIRHSFYNLVYN